MTRVRTVLLRLAGAYVVAAVIGRIGEALGMHRCGCPPDCWCKRPILSTFRWVFPYRHKLVDPHDKKLADDSRMGA